MSSKRRELLGLAGWFAATFAAAAVGGVGSVDAPAFYSELTLPNWAPPAGVFGPVWTILYTLMAVAAWLVWRVRGFHGARTALGLFLVHLVFNAAWSWLFFVWRMGAAALADIIVLIALILVVLAGFWRVKPLAGLLLVPYLLWVVFASVLNHALWRLNPHLLG